MVHGAEGESCGSSTGQSVRRRGSGGQCLARGEVKIKLKYGALGKKSKWWGAGRGHLRPPPSTQPARRLCRRRRPAPGFRRPECEQSGCGTAAVQRRAAAGPCPSASPTAGRAEHEAPDYEWHQWWHATLAHTGTAPPCNRPTSIHKPVATPSRPAPPTLSSPPV